MAWLGSLIFYGANTVLALGIVVVEAYLDHSCLTQCYALTGWEHLLLFILNCSSILVPVFEGLSWEADDT